NHSMGLPGPKVWVGGLLPTSEFLTPKDMDRLLSSSLDPNVEKVVVIRSSVSDHFVRTCRGANRFIVGFHQEKELESFLATSYLKVDWSQDGQVSLNEAVQYSSDEPHVFVGGPREFYLGRPGALSTWVKDSNDS